MSTLIFFILTTVVIRKILVMQSFQEEIIIEYPESLSAGVYIIQVTSGKFHSYFIFITEPCITILYHALESTVPNTINATIAGH